MKARVILCCLVIGLLAAANGTSKRSGGFHRTCPASKSKHTSVSTSRHGYPEKSITAALAKNKVFSSQLKHRKSQKAYLASHNAGCNKPPHYKICPFVLKRVWRAYGCWVHWPVIKTAHCTQPYCYPWWPLTRRGKCLPHDFKTWSVLLACPGYPYWRFRWARITVPCCCICWPCW